MIRSLYWSAFLILEIVSIIYSFLPKRHDPCSPNTTWVLTNEPPSIIFADMLPYQQIYAVGNALILLKRITTTRSGFGADEQCWPQIFSNTNWRRINGDTVTTRAGNDKSFAGSKIIVQINSCKKVLSQFRHWEHNDKRSKLNTQKHWMIKSTLNINRKYNKKI